MAGIKALRKIQMGAENTAGTAVAATTIFRGTGTLGDQTEVTFAEEDIGFLAGVDRTYIAKVGGQAGMEGEATFEQLPYILMGGVDGAVTPTGASTAKTWTFTFATSAQKTPKTYTIEGGDNQQAEEMAYCFVEEFSIEGAVDEAVKVSATWRGRQISPTTFTASLSLPTVEEILTNKFQLWIDNSGGTVGSALKSNTLLSFKLAVKTGLVAVQAADGQLYFSFVKQTAPEVTLEITFEHDGTAVVEKAAWLAQTVRLVRLKGTGSAIGATTRSLQIDLAGKWEKFDALEDKDGNDVVTGTLRARWSNADYLFAQVVVVNALASLP